MEITTGIGWLRKLSKELPGDDEDITVDVAVLLIRDRWTDADSQKWGEKSRDMIFAWARQSENHLPERRHRPDLWLCLHCGKVQAEHTGDEYQKCKQSWEDLTADGLCGNCNRISKDHSPEEKKACSVASQAEHEASPCITCGKPNKDHSREEDQECLDEFIRRKEEGLDRHLAHQAALKRAKAPWRDST